MELIALKCSVARTRGQLTEMGETSELRIARPERMLDNGCDNSESESSSSCGCFKSLVPVSVWAINGVPKQFLSKQGDINSKMECLYTGSASSVCSRSQLARSVDSSFN